MRVARPTAKASWVAVVVLAVLGLVLAGVGTGLRTIWLPDDNYAATAKIPPNTPVVVTAPGVLEMRPGPVQVRATGSSEQTVVIARGREADVRAWVGRGEAATITGLSDENTLKVAMAKGTRDLPSIADSDLWIDQAEARGAVNYTYRPTTGRYLLIFGVTGGPGAPTSITFTWPRAVATPWSLPLIVAGGLLLLLALALAGRTFGAQRRAAAAEIEGTLRPQVSLRKAEPDSQTESEPESEAQSGASDDTVALPSAAGDDTAEVVSYRADDTVELTGGDLPDHRSPDSPEGGRS